ncbi:hypothetical protein Pst134EA_026763 [Puccinia striiformis f. sp. tritici]|uniref:hypothetical protein n=1 Tax=Puccinia striiformis f. sp. tritici TaxID=168172 RepID=UPI002007DD99|nr:hypothetical protein Pst134EA_026763 [Puccinia striiformis f. sp. tritici]KAH9442971.1 hypothetical protein Pst134EB_027322 [Puccinia striiformis f. sp. tritici]KAH9445092.1 hypothetical protein Pst134EB_025343 [Puccinia striiformis f. sp. tritici]KAH9450050.1 hypothetical protein Pst134EA_026763 [Puccinia striiformis f. sp. tritici]
MHMSGRLEARGSARNQDHPTTQPPGHPEVFSPPKFAVFLHNLGHPPEPSSIRPYTRRPTAHLDTPHPTTPPLTFLAFTIGIIHLHNRRYLNQDRWLACAVTSLPSIICFWFSPTFIVLS